MRNLFTVNVKTREHGCDEFLIRKSDTALKAQYDKNSKYIDGTLKKKYAPLIYLSFAPLICGAAGIAIFAGESKDAGIAQAYSSFGWALYMGIAGIALFTILLFTAIIRVRKFLNSPQMQNVFKEQEELEEKIARNILIPEGCA